jgi:uncharacterized protein
MTAILWRRLDEPGHDSARLVFHDGQWHLTGTAVFVEAREPCRLDYRVVCDASWRTMAASVAGWLGNRAISIELRADSAGHWHLNDADCPAVAGCLDVDLSFTPATNLLPIRRLALPIGEKAAVRSAWLTFPALTLEPLDQLYRRTHVSTYAYESNRGSFSTELEVNGDGFVTVYPNLWEAEATTAS